MPTSHKVLTGAATQTPKTRVNPAAMSNQTSQTPGGGGPPHGTSSGGATSQPGLQVMALQEELTAVALQAVEPQVVALQVVEPKVVALQEEALQVVVNRHHNGVTTFNKSTWLLLPTPQDSSPLILNSFHGIVTTKDWTNSSLPMTSWTTTRKEPY